MRFSPNRLLAGAAVVSVVIGGVYVVAATTASSMAGTFNTTESDESASRAEWQSAITRASERYATAREHCDQYKYAKRELCHAAARRGDMRHVQRDALAEERAP